MRSRSRSRSTSPREPGAFCDENAAFWKGLSISVFLALPTFCYAVGYIWTTIGQMFWLLLALYPTLMMVQFWASRSYKNGMTKTEIMYALGFLADIVRSIRFGMRAARGLPTGMDIRECDDMGHKVLSEPQAKLIGIALSVLSGVMFLFGLWSSLSIGWSLLALAGLLWILGTITYYWVSQVYKGGLTKMDLVKTLLGPVMVFVLVRAAAKEYAAMRNLPRRRTQPTRHAEENASYGISDDIDVDPNRHPRLRGL